jgi:hypothetical protein
MSRNVVLIGWIHVLHIYEKSFKILKKNNVFYYNRTDYIN